MSTTATFTTTTTKMALASPTRRTSIPITTSTTTTATLATDHHATPCCPKCGFDLHTALALDAPLDSAQIALLDAQRQIEDLQAQVRLLNQKASAAVDRWADYEDELAKLRATVDRQQMQQMQGQGQTLGTGAAVNAGNDASEPRSSFLPAGAATRLSALLGPRKSTPNLKAVPPPPTPSSQYSHQASQKGHMSRLSQPSNSNNSLSNYLPMTPRSPFGPGSAHLAPASPTGSSLSTDDLLEALSREQAARVAAEGRLTETSREVEELSVSLFEQANEMVATERRARARLEERVETLERRDVEKRRRLDRLESAVGRIERVKALLGETNAMTSTTTMATATKVA